MLTSALNGRKREIVERQFALVRAVVLFSNAEMDHPQKGEGFPGQRIVVLPRAVVAGALKHPLLRGLLPTDAGHFLKAAGHLRQRIAGVDQAILIHCVKGRGWCELGGQRHPVNPGDLLVIPPRTAHTYGADTEHPWTISWVHAAGTNVDLLLGELGVTRERPVLFLGEAPQLFALFEELLEVLEHGYAPAHLLYAAQTLTHLIGAMIWQRQRSSRDDRDPNQKIMRSIAYMKQHLDKPLPAARLAALANLSASHYSAVFKRQTGYAPIDYFMRLRMHQACQLLDTTRFSIKEIAAMVGYQDQFYFWRVFKSVNEVSPSEYRLMHKG